MLKKILKVVAALLLVLLLAAGAFFVHVWYFKPYSIDLFFARTALKIALESPELLSTLRVLEPMGRPHHPAALRSSTSEQKSSQPPRGCSTHGLFLRPVRLTWRVLRYALPASLRCVFGQQPLC